MLARLLPFELNLQIKQVGFWITIAIVFLMGLGIASLDFGTTGERIKSNGALAVAALESGLSVLAMFFGAIYVVSGVMRDDVSKSLEIIHATPVPTPAMIISRFIGAYLATFLSLFAMVLGVFSAQFAPWIDEEAFGPINLLYYIQPLILFVALNAFLVTAIFTAIASITRDRALVYVSSVALFILYTMAGSFVGDSTPELLVSLIDPFGTNALAQATEFWPAAEQNTRLVPLGGYVGINRIVWTLVAIVLFVASFRLSRRGIGASRKTRRGEMADQGATGGPLVLHKLTAPLGKRGLPVLLMRTRFEYVAAVRSIAFMVLGGVVIMFFALGILIRNEVTPTPTLPTSVALAQITLGAAFLPLLLITVFFAGEIVWRDRVAKVTELLDTTVTANWPLMLSKWLAMFALILTIITVGMILGIAGQMVLGDVSVNLGTHLTNAYGIFAPRLLFYAALVMFIQNFMPNRVVGMIVGGVVIGIMLFGLPQWPSFHPLMNFGGTPIGGFSEMNGFGDVERYRWFFIYWSGLCGLFAVLTIWLWRRGLQTSLLQRLRSFGSQLSLATGAFALVSTIAFAGAGWTIFKGYNIDNDFLTRKEGEQRLTSLENELGDKLETPLPKIRDVSVDVQFYPADRSADAKGSYRIENITGKPVEQLYITMAATGDDVRSLEIEGASWSHETDMEKRHAEGGIRLYKFDTPLAPGATTELTFDVHHPTPTLGGGRLIRENGTFVNHQQILPTLGLIDFRMQNPDRRRKNDLPPLEGAADRTDLDARKYSFFDRASDYVNFSATVCTDPGQIPIAPGRMLRAYEQDGRACRDYKPNQPIAFFFAFVSADYSVAEDTWTRPTGETVDLAIYYDAKHNYNIDLMVEAMKDSLDTFTETFGPYQYDTLRIMEFPYGNFAQSFAGTIPFSENIGFVIDPGDAEDQERVDLATYVTMHEIGHQWFGHQIMPANVKGFNVLSEGLTENAAMTAYERKFGWRKARRVLEQRSVQQYLVARTVEASTEEPLATARGGQQYLVYAKASWVFWGLKQYIGEDNMQAGIRNLLAKYGATGPLYPTTLDLVEELRNVAGPDYQQLITDYWDRITFWQLSFDDDATEVSANGDGSFTVDFLLELDKKVASEKTGREISVTEAEYGKPEKPEAGSEDTATEEAGETPAADATETDVEEEPKGPLIRPAEALNEWIEIGFYDKDPQETFGDDWLKLERVHITEMETKLSFDLETRPTHIRVDPRRLLMERNVGDNTIDLPEGDDS